MCTVADDKYPSLSLIMLALPLLMLKKEMEFVEIIRHFLAPIKRSAHVHVITLNDT